MIWTVLDCLKSVHMEKESQCVNRLRRRSHTGRFVCDDYDPYRSAPNVGRQIFFVAMSLTASLCSRMVTVLAWTEEEPGFESWFGHLSRVGMLQD